MTAIMGRLILKDLFLLRWISLGAIGGGLIAVALMSLSPMVINSGGVLVICALIVLNIFLVMFGVVQERKDKATLFALSLPVSPVRYAMAKVAANIIAFAVPWFVISVGVIVVITTSQLPDGVLPFWMVLLTYLFFYYCVLLAVGLNVDSTGWHAVAITAGNISVNFFIGLLISLPSVQPHLEAQTAVWTTDLTGLAAAAFAGAAIALAAGIGIYARRRDFV